MVSMKPSCRPVLWLAGLAVLSAILAPAATAGGPERFEPAARFDQPWNIVSLAEDGDLDDTNIFFVDFATDGTAWLATATGLVRYDGYQWRRFGRDDGLPSDFVRSVLVARDGRVWVGTDSGVAVSNGEAFEALDPSALAGPSVRRIVEDPDGTIWFCSDTWPVGKPSGGLTTYRDGMWSTAGLDDGLATDYIVDYLRTTDGRQYVVTLDGLFVRRGTVWTIVPHEPIREPSWQSATLVEDRRGRLFVSAGHDVLVVQDGRVAERFTIHDRFRFAVGATDDGVVVAVGQTAFRNMQFVTFVDGRIEAVSAGIFQPGGASFVDAVRRAPDGSLWAVGHRLVVRWARGAHEWTAYPELRLPALVDGTGAVWFHGSDGAAVRRRAHAWDRWPGDHRGFVTDTAGAVWALDGASVTAWFDDRPRRFTGSDTGVPDPAAATPDPTGGVWINGASRSGSLVATRWSDGGWSSPIELSVTMPSRVFQAADPIDGVWFGWDGDAGPVLAHVIGDEQRRYAVPPIASRFAFRFAVESERRVWVFGESGLHSLDPSTGAFSSYDDVPGVVRAAALSRGEAWFTLGTFLGGAPGLLRYHLDEWQRFPTSSIGSAATLPDGTLMFSSIDLVTEVPPVRPVQLRRIPLPGNEEAVGALRDPDGDLWVGVGDRVLRRRTAESVPDTRLLDGDVAAITSWHPFQIRVAVVDRFTPVDPTRPFRLSWRLDEGEWSSFTDAEPIELSTAELGGRHTVDVRAQDEDLDVDPTPARLTLDVAPIPIEGRPWFVPAVALAAVGLVGLALAATVSRRRVLNTQGALEAANAELEAFTYAVSHDLQAPLRNIERLAAQIDDRRLPGTDDTTAGTLGRIRGLTARMQRLIDGLLELSQVTRASLVRQPIDLTALARSVAADVEALDSSGTVRWDIQDGLMVEGDMPLVRNLLRNLIDNAWKFTRNQPDPTVAFGATRLSSGAQVFHVRDNGAGFDPALADRLFAPFQRLHDASEFPGDGIGLATVRRIARRHGGRAWADASPGRGAAFFFTLEPEA